MNAEAELTAYQASVLQRLRDRTLPVTNGQTRTVKQHLSATELCVTPQVLKELWTKGLASRYYDGARFRYCAGEALRGDAAASKTAESGSSPDTGARKG